MFGFEFFLFKFWFVLPLLGFRVFFLVFWFLGFFFPDDPFRQKETFSIVLCLVSGKMEEKREKVKES